MLHVGRRLRSSSSCSSLDAAVLGRLSEMDLSSTDCHLKLQLIRERRLDTMLLFTNARVNARISIVIKTKKASHIIIGGFARLSLTRDLNFFFISRSHTTARESRASHTHDAKVREVKTTTQPMSRASFCFFEQKIQISLSRRTFTYDTMSKNEFQLELTLQPARPSLLASHQQTAASDT